MQTVKAQESDVDRIADPAGYAMVNDVLLQSFVDGPGNRAVVFLQGCNLRCLICHNPYTINLCNSCGVCVPVCPHGALATVEGVVAWDPEACVQCDACIEACSRSSSPKTRKLTAEQLWKEMAGAAAFDSGVSVSGGEPTLQTDFLIDFFGLVKRTSDLDTLIETNGCVARQDLDRLCAVTDMFMVDLKAVPASVHRQLTGSDNSAVLETIRFLTDRGKLYQVRQVVIPGFNDTPEDAVGLANLLMEIDPSISLRFLRFRPHGTRGIASTWQPPSEAKMDELVEATRAAGIVDTGRSI